MQGVSIMTNSNEFYVSCVLKALDLGDKISRSSINTAHSYYEKGNRDFALEVDQAIETKVKSLLIEQDATIPILGEEFSWEQNEEKEDIELFWVVDPIDGTVNYSRQLPLFGISIALIYQNKPIISGISFPLLNERYIAVQGGGAFLNGGRINVSRTSNIANSIIGFGDFAVGSKSLEKNELRYKVIKFYADKALRIRMLGTAALQLAWLASGRIDISLTLSNNAWDVQAGVLLVREAGGEVFDYDGSSHDISSKYTLASNANLQVDALEYFNYN